MADSDIIIQATFKYTEEGADQVVAANQAVEQSTAEMSKSTETATSGLSEVGGAASKAGEEVGATAANFSAVEQSFMAVKESSAEAEEGLAGAAKGSESAGEGFDLLGHGGMMTAMMFMQVAQMAAQVIGAMAKAHDAAMATADAFTYLTGSGTKAQAELANLNTTWAAAKFGTQNIDNVAQHLLMAGENADQVQKEIERVSDAVAAMGGSAQQIEPVIDKLHSMQQEGAITDQDMKDLAKDGVAGYQMLAEGLSVLRGHTVSEAEAMQEVKDKAISGNEAYKAMMTGMMQYTGQAQASSNSLGAEWQRLGEHATAAFGPILDELAKILEGINKIIESSASLGDVFQMLSNMTRLFGGFALGVPGMPGFAAGGSNLPPGLRVVGEHGPEIQWSQGGDTIFPTGTSLAEVLDMIGGSGSGGGGGISSLSSGGGGQSTPIIVQLQVDGRQMAQVVIPHIAPMARTISGRRV